MVTNTKTRTVYYNARYYMLSTQENNVISKFQSNIRTLTRTRVGSGLPHWKDLIKGGKPATTGLTATYHILYGRPVNCSFTYRYKLSDGGFTAVSPAVVNMVDGDYDMNRIATPSPNFGWASTADRRAANKYLSKCRSTQQSFSAPIFLGELRETMRMLRHPAEGIWRSVNGYYEALRKRKRYDPINYAKAAHGLWLEYSFGWLPLMNDIASAKKALQNLFERETTREVSGSAQDSYLLSTSSSNGGYVAGLYLQGTFTDVKREQITVRYKGACKIHTVTTSTDKLALFGFQPSEFLPTVWELLPWSFLIDYFVSIGDYLDARGAVLGDIIWTNKTVRKRSFVHRTSSFDYAKTKVLIPAVAVIGGHGSDGFATYVVTTVDRTGGAPPIPALYVKWAGPGWGQYANMSALFGQFCSNLHAQNPGRRNYRL
jgi:hypothetical protein